MSQKTRNDERKLKELLRNEIDGAHGMSERRAAAQFVLDAMEGNEAEDGRTFTQGAKLADSLAGFCKDLAVKISKLR